MTEVQRRLCCFLGCRRSDVPKGRPFKEDEFVRTKQTVKNDTSPPGPGIEVFLHEMETPPTSLGRCLIDTFRKYHDHILQVNVTTGETITYNEVLSEALALAGGLRSRGVAPGNTLGFLGSPSDPKANAIILASVIIGALFEPIDPENHLGRSLQKLIQKGPRIVFCVEKPLREVATALQKVPGTLLVSLDGKPDGDDHPVAGVEFLADLLKRDSNDGEASAALGPRDVIVVLQGESDGDDVSLANGTLLRYTAPKMRISDEVCEDRLLDHEDWSGGGEAWITRRLFLLRSGGSVLVAVPPYHPEDTLALVQKHRVSWLALKCTQLIALGECGVIVGYDLSSLLLINAPSGGSALYPLEGKRLDSIRLQLPSTRILIGGKTVADAVTR